ncbi:MAG: low molecular weight protein-tyrosine-phosphatase [Mariprofundales bacterium]|nr:low molecular weight protein-tyrosine-phosphatase [Mariprofundales bacterium]
MTTPSSAPMRVLFVCLGNICRSPLAEVIANHEAERMGVAARFHFASAGTGNWHVGGGADPRSAQTAQTHGLDLSTHTAQQITAPTIGDWQWFIAMDADNHTQLLAMGVPANRLWMMRQFEPNTTTPPDVPDPYYGGADGFDHMYQLLGDNAARVIGQLLKQAA